MHNLTGFLISIKLNLMASSKSKNIIILGMIAFLAMSFFSLSSISMDMNGRMINCPFMNSISSLCQMSVSDHINQWQQFFTMIREKSLLLSLLSVSLYIVGFFITIKTYEKLKYQLFRNYFYRYRPEIKLFNNLELAFSRGIIHSKIYA